MRFLHRIRLDIQLTATVVWRYVIASPRVYGAVAIFVVMLLVLQWLFNIQELRYVLLRDNNLTLLGKVEYMTEAFINIFRYANAFTPISMIIIAALQAMAISLLLLLRKIGRSSKNASASQLGTLFVAVVGAGCVACGGSLLTPILAAVASGVSLALAEQIGSIVLVLAIILSYVALSRVAFRLAREVHTMER